MLFKIKIFFVFLLKYGKGFLILRFDFMYVYYIEDGVWRGVKLLNVKKIVDDVVDICIKS